MVESEEEIAAFGAELSDRFGPLPEEADQLLKLVAIKLLCRRANVEKLDAGPLGGVATFRHGTFANPEGLIAFITGEGERARVRSDQSLVLRRDWDTVAERLQGAETMLRQIVHIAEQTEPAAARA
jgi:transcription-repair coupling factor (superfamily II helicase)